MLSLLKMRNFNYIKIGVTHDTALLLQYGYKPIIMAEYPSDGGYYTDSWTETETEITQVWTAAEPPEDISADEALDIITGGAEKDSVDQE